MPRHIVTAPELVRLYAGTAVKRSTIYALLKAGRLPSIRLGAGRYLIDVETADRFFSGQEDGSPSQPDQQRKPGLMAPIR